MWSDVGDVGEKLEARCLGCHLLNLACRITAHHTKPSFRDSSEDPRPYFPSEPKNTLDVWGVKKSPGKHDARRPVPRRSRREGVKISAIGHDVDRDRGQRADALSVEFRSGDNPRVAREPPPHKPSIALGLNEASSAVADRGGRALAAL